MKMTRRKTNNQVTFAIIRMINNSEYEYFFTNFYVLHYYLFHALIPGIPFSFSPVSFMFGRFFPYNI
jgi:hypothetical protein